MMKLEHFDEIGTHGNCDFDKRIFSDSISFLKGNIYLLTKLCRRIFF